MNYVQSLLIWIMLASYSQAQTAVAPKLPSGYLYKVEPGIPGKTIYVCGQRPFNDAGDLVGAGDLGTQIRQVFENLKISLATVGMTLKDIAQIKYLIKEVSASGPAQVSNAKANLLKGIEATYFTEVPKLAETKAVTLTVREDVLVEVEAITVK